MFADESSHVDSLWVSSAIGAVRVLTFVYDIISFPVYLVLQRPWRRRQLANRVKAKPVKIEHNSIIYRTTEEPRAHHVMLLREGVDTLEKMLTYVAKVHGNKRCLGTRQILGEEDEVQPNGRVFKKYNLGEYKWKSFAEFDRMASFFGKGLRELGMQPRENIAIFAETRAEWLIAAHGCFKQNLTCVTIYATLGDEAIAHGINETEVTTVITSHELLPKFRQILAMTPKVRNLIYMEDQLQKTPTNGFQEGSTVLSFTQILKLGSESKFEGSPPMPQDIAIIMYTSGSTGVPKGVLLSHTNLIATMKAFCDIAEIREDDLFLGFLPLAHVFELLVESVCLVTGVAIGYSTPLTMIDSSSKIKRGTKGDASVLYPTVMSSVPLILDRISKGIAEKVAKNSPFARALFRFAYDYKTKWTRRGYSTPIIDKMIFSKVRSLLGGKVRMILSGGAPLSPDTHEQIRNCLCVDMIQGYGLTETTSGGTVMDKYDTTSGRVGAPSTMCDIRLINWEEGNYRVSNKPYPQGEICIGGDSVSQGYYKLPTKTQEDYYFEDEKRWFRTGDIGEMHPDGVLKIIDRKKDLVKLQAGEYVSLGKVEAELKTCPIVENICVYGDPTKQYTVALVVPNPKLLLELAVKAGIAGCETMEFEELCASPILEKKVLEELAEHGKKCKLQKFEVPAALKLVTEVWSPDMGLVTAAFKLKRKDIQERYQGDINRMYAS